MPLALPLLLCQCAIFLVSFEGIVCALFDFVIENFSIADIYPLVKIAGTCNTKKFVFRKSLDNTASSRRYVVRFSDILRETIRVEGNNESVVSFSVRGADCSNFNIKFKCLWQAHYFVTNADVIPNQTTYFAWARIYSNWRPVIIAYEYLDDDDIGLKLLKNEDFSNLDEYLYEQPFILKRSDIENEIRTRPPQMLYLRSKSRIEDYEIRFQSTDNLDDFLRLFPERIHDECKTVGYYFIPYRKDFSRSHEFDDE